MSMIATYQGYPLRDLEYTRSRGYTPNGAEMTFLASDFPVGFQFVTPQPGALAVPASLPSEARLPAGDEPQGPAPIARQLAFEGWLVMAESVGGTEWRHPPVRLFVVSVDTARSGQGVTLVKVVAYDERYFWEAGWCRRWSFNRKRADGLVSKDSVKADGSLFSKYEIAEQVTASLFRKPKLAAAPNDWRTLRPSVNFQPNSPALVALAQMVRDGDLEPPSLLLDGSIGLYRAGEGKVGYAASWGAPNALDFPPELLLDKSGTGQGHTVEYTYATDWLVVAGGPRICSVAIDDLEPVVIVDGIVFVLNEANVRFLTGGKFGLEWLAKFMLLSADLAGDPSVPEPVLEAFRSQAFHLWRIPGVEVETAADPGSPGQAVVREPGPLAHLMPMLPRAETTAGRRDPVQVERYTFALRHRALEGSGTAERQRQALMELAKVRREIQAAARLKAANEGNNLNPFGAAVGGFDPFAGRRVTANRLTGREEVAVDRVLSFEARDALHKAGLSAGDLQSYVNQARLVERISTDMGGGYAQQYETALKDRFAAEDEANGGTQAATLYELAKQFLAAEKQANDQGSLFDTTTEAFRETGQVAALSNAVEAAARKLRLEEEARRARRAAGGGTEDSDSNAMTYMVNVARTVDAGARVVDAERGIVETSGISGHLAKLPIHGLAHPDAALKVLPKPCPVRVIFGTHLRPRVDVPYGTRPRPRTGDEPQEGDQVDECRGGDNVIPRALTDEESYYLQAFRRAPDGTPVRVALADVPADQALVVQRPDLVELVPLEGESNRAALDLEAEVIARELFRRKAIVKSSRHVIARPWPVNCDGVVSQVTVRMRQKDGAPCGFETEILCGSEGLPGSGPTREDPARRGAAALRAQNEAARREGLKT